MAKINLNIEAGDVSELRRVLTVLATAINDGGTFVVNGKEASAGDTEDDASTTAAAEPAGGGRRKRRTRAEIEADNAKAETAASDDHILRDDTPTDPEAEAPQDTATPAGDDDSNAWDAEPETAPDEPVSDEALVRAANAAVATIGAGGAAKVKKTIAAKYTAKDGSPAGLKTVRAEDRPALLRWLNAVADGKSAD